MSGIRPAHSTHGSQIFSAQLLLQRLRIGRLGLRVPRCEALHLGQQPDVFFRAPFPSAGVLDELVGRKVDRVANRLWLSVQLRTL